MNSDSHWFVVVKPDVCMDWIWRRAPGRHASSRNRTLHPVAFYFPHHWFWKNGYLFRINVTHFIQHIIHEFLNEARRISITESDLESFHQSIGFDPLANITLYSLFDSLFHIAPPWFNCSVLNACRANNSKGTIYRPVCCVNFGKALSWYGIFCSQVMLSHIRLIRSMVSWSSLGGSTFTEEKIFLLLV